MCDSDDDALYFYRREKEVAAPDTHGDQCAFRPGPLDRGQGFAGEHGSGRTQRMSQCDGFSVGIYAHSVQSKLSDTWDGLRRKGLVEFNDIKVVYRASGYGEKLFDCGDGAYAHVGRRYAYHGMGNKTGVWGDAAHRFDPTADDHILLSRQYGVGSGLWSGRRYDPVR